MSNKTAACDGHLISIVGDNAVNTRVTAKWQLLSSQNVLGSAIIESKLNTELWGGFMN